MKFEKEQVVQDMISQGRNSNLELPDLLIALAAKSSGCDSVMTFDKKVCQGSIVFSLVVKCVHMLVKKAVNAGTLILCSNINK
jgi:hypothetical protein